MTVPHIRLANFTFSRGWALISVLVLLQAKALVFPFCQTSPLLTLFVCRSLLT